MRYQIENIISGEVLGQFDADSEADALDQLARAAGYVDYAEARRVSPSADDELAVTVVHD